jgi:protein-disulfide isomerase
MRPTFSGPLLAAALSMAALPAVAETAAATWPSEAEREALHGEIRDYLLANPDILMEMLALIEERKASETAASDLDMVASNAAAIFEDGYSFVGGNPEGSFTIVEFLDYQCGFCRRAHPELMELIESDGDIRWIVKEFPILGPQSDMAARFAISVKRIAGDTAYGAVHAALMTFRGESSEASLSALADRMSLDTRKIIAGMAAPETEAVIAANAALAARLLISGTPGFIFETEVVRGYVPLEGMVGLVDDLRG